MNLSKRFLQAAALLPLVAASTAMAATENHGSASASISNLRIQLIDLDPNDGISPYLSYRPDPALQFDIQSSTWVRHLKNDDAVREQFKSSTNAFDAAPASLVLHSPADLPAGSATGTAAIAGTSLDTLTLSTSIRFDDVAGQSNAIFSAVDFDPLYFYLSPNTSLSLTFDMSVQTALQGGSALSASQGDSAQASASLSLFGRHVGPNAPQEFSVAHATYAASGRPPEGTPGTRTFTALFDSGAAEEAIYIKADLRSYVQISPDGFVPAPVPEPSTWAMLVGGLGMIGAMARRRSHSTTGR